MRSAKDLQKEYATQSPALEKWGDFITAKVANEIQEKLRSEQRDFEAFFKVPPKSRLKRVESFIVKALYRGKNYKDPIVDITDKVGTRFVVLLNQEVEEVASIIESQASWSVRCDRDFEEEKKSKPTHFDYQSKHYVVSPKKSLTVEGIIIGPEITCEVQVRTLLQHAYSELAHDTVYKPKINVESKAVYREIAKSMALIETTGDIFTKVAAEIRSEYEQYDGLFRILLKIYSNKVGQPPDHPRKMEEQFLAEISDLKQTLNESDLEKFLEEKPYIVNRIAERRIFDPFYRSCIAPAAYFLAARCTTKLSEVWPLPVDIKEEIFSDLSISNEG